MLDQVIIHDVLTLLENNLKASETYLQQPSVVMAREDIHGCKEQRKPQNIVEVLCGWVAVAMFI